MKFSFSDKEAAILLGAMLMHWGLPFRKATRRPLNDNQQAVLDRMSDRLVEMSERKGSSIEFEISPEEAGLCVMVLEDCVHECTDDATEMRLQLKTDRPSEIDAVLVRLSTCSANRQRQFSESA